MGEQVNLAQILQQLTQALNSINGGNAEKQHSDLFATINTQISEFSYDPETDRTFSAWFERYGPYIERDGQNLPDEMKVRLLIGKLGSTEYVRYTEGILPQKPTQILFKDTVEKLEKLFCGTKSLFVRRFEAFQLTKADHQSPIEFADQVNASCETAKMELSKEEVKALIFVSGIGDSDRDLREKCLKLMEEAHLRNTPIRFASLVEECRTALSLRSSAAALSRPMGPNTNSISVKPQRIPERSRRSLARGQSRSPTRFRSTHSRPPQGSRSVAPTPPSPCRWCNQMHWMRECNKRPTCAKCGRLGHREKDCRVNNNNFRGGNNQKRSSMSVLSVDGNTDSWLTLDCLINARPVSLMIDTGSRITIIQTQLWEKLGKPPLHTGKSQGKSYSGHNFELTGSFNCDVTYAGVTLKLQCYVTPDGVLNLFGLPWIRAFESKLRRPIATTLEFESAPPVVATLSAPTSADELTALLKREFPIVFSPGLGHCNRMKAHLYLQSGAQPVFCRARPVPHGAREAVDAELDRLLKIGAIKQIDYSQWAAPIVAVKKKSGEIRVCIDFSTGLNDRLELNRHPLPRPEDIFNAIRGASIFSQIDFKDAYLQVELDETSKHLVGLNTHRGLFQYQRLPFGVKSAPSIFQKLMDELIAGLPGVFVYLDDFVVASANHQDHCSTLRTFFSRLQEWGLRVRLSKCKFMCEQLKFLGPDPARSAAIESMPAPTNAQTLRSFLGAINYYSRFVKQMREIRTPLDELLKKDVSWHWGPAQQHAFDTAKQILQSELLLTHYDPDKPITVAADASKDGIGATISHTFSNGSEKVVEHASRSLTPAEINYSQIEKEALGLVFAVQKFHRMLYGRSFTLLTDHKPLISIFGSKTGIPIYTASRLQRWALTLMNYDFKIKYISTKNFGQVDMLSRLIAARRDANGDERVIASAHQNPSSLLDDDAPDLSAAAVEYVFQANIDQLPVVAEEIAACTANDETLCQVLQHCRTHWPKEAASSPLSAFFVHRSKLSEVQGCLLFGDRVIIPTELRQRILTALHFTHPGMVRMKSLARQFVYWPKIDMDIERWVRNCPDCALAAKTPPKVPLRPWPSAEAVYERVHMDFAGPCRDGFKYLVVVDAHSKWPEVIRMNATSAPFLITQLTWLFSRYGFPKEIVSDNGPPFKSSELSHFCRSKGIKQTFSPPFHPQSNGQAERFVDILKRQMRKCARDDNDWVQNSLLAYRSTPSEVLRGRTPAELFLGRPIRTVLSLVKPGSGVKKGGKFNQDRDRMCRQFDRRHGAHQRLFNIGDRVLFLNYRQNKRMWLPGEVVGGSGVVWKVWAQDLRATVTRHSNQMRRSQPIPYQDRPEQQQIPRTPSPERRPAQIQEEPPQQQATPRKVHFEDNLPRRHEPEEQQQLRRSTRQRKPVKRLDL